MNNLYALIFLFTTVFTGLAQDDCGNSLPLTFDASNQTPLTIIDSDLVTASGVNATCQNAPIDAWYSFVMPVTGTIKVFNVNSGTEVAIYSGTCASLVSESCGNSLTYAYDLVAGETYYVQAWKQVFQGSNIQFQLEAFEVSANDDCGNAENLILTTNQSPLVSVDSDSFTASGIDATCQTAPIDAWYEFTMPVDGTMKVYNVNSGTEVAVYSGTCGTLVSEACSTGLFYANNLTAGTSYYVQAWKQVFQGSEIQFQLEAFEVSANDDCGNAEPLPFTGTETTLVTVDSDTFTPSGIDATCQTAPIDAWYEFTMPVDGNIKVFNINSGTEVAVYSGTCGALSSESCRSGTSFTFSLNQGEIYYLQAWKQVFQGSDITFQLSAHETVPNDECLTALQLSFDSNNMSENLFEWEGATISVNPATCQNANSQDGWFVFESPINGTYQITGTSGAEYSVYEASDTDCFGAEIACFTNNGNFNVVQGEEYIIRAFRSVFSEEIQMNLQPTATPVSLASNGACVGGGTSVIPDVTIDASNNNEWVNILDDVGDVVASLNANGNNLGTVSTELFIDTNDFFTYDPGDGNLIYYLRRYLTIDVETQPTMPVDVRVYFKSDEFSDLNNIDPSINGLNDLSILKVNDQACADVYNGEIGEAISLTPQFYSFGDYSAEFQVSSFSKFLLMSDQNAAILPVKLESFTAEKEGNRVNLAWVTASEVNNEGFEIQHSTNGLSWDLLGWMNGAGDSTERLEYVFVDQNPENGINYYRLKQIDFDGTSEFSDVVSVAFSHEAKVTMYPNPVHRSLQIETNGLTIKRLRIIDVNGQIVLEQDLNSSTTELDLSQFANGLYIVEMYHEEGVNRQNIIKN